MYLVRVRVRVRVRVGVRVRVRVSLTLTLTLTPTLTLTLEHVPKHLAQAEDVDGQSSTSRQRHVGARARIGADAGDGALQELRRRVALRTHRGHVDLG